LKRSKSKNNDGLFKGILMAHVVLILHLLLFAGMGILVAFVGGVLQYMVWIFLAGMVLVALSAYLFMRRLRREGKSIVDTLRSPMFRGRSVEVTLLGGMATLRLDQSGPKPTIEGSRQAPLQIEDPETAKIREINQLAKLLEKELITRDEFSEAKQRLLRHEDPHIR
jgi:hypothetical protein